MKEVVSRAELRDRSISGAYGRVAPTTRIQQNTPKANSRMHVPQAHLNHLSEDDQQLIWIADQIVLLHLEIVHDLSKLYTAT